ncbi:hypothetical protein NM688_g3983 [Phlebia brevispora]|uniref:Uncharacterized protein n=1 Tax=Phlebia brevispora TaxID=194682 RepID=A0ACC1T4F2_9APHY|nr:hypothetical protein NM688_g3983 [Phlebia brevispora]
MTSINWALEGVAQLCSVEILEFGTEEEFHSKPGYYGLYPTFSDANLTTYRPTNEDCLMRIVTTPDFCNACMEGLWLSLLKRVDLIDDVVAGCAQNHWTKNWYRLLEVQWVPLAHWYGNPNAPYGYTVEWFKNGEKLHFPDLSRISLGDADAPGVYTVKVKYRTPQVLVDKEHLLSSEATITVSDYCRPTSTGLM